MSLHRNTELFTSYVDLAFQLSGIEQQALCDVYNLPVGRGKHQRGRS